MSSQFGSNFKISIFGQSHSFAIGLVVDGLPAGYSIDLDELRAFMQRRSPGQSELTTARTEADEPEVLSGLVDGVTCGAPLAIMIRNTDARSDEYREIRDIPRPSHADYTAHIKYGGHQDVSGGGHFSGRLTAPLCAAGGICLQLLAQRDVHICAHILQIGDIRDDTFDAVNVSLNDFGKIRKNSIPVLDEAAGNWMKGKIAQAQEVGDSLGGIIECAAIGLPVGWGDPMFDGIENRIAAIVFGIPAVKGIEFGSGFASAQLKGSENNDRFYMDGSTVKTKSNHSGGILGGITNGMPVIFKAAFKPTPTIGMEQESISLSKMEDTILQVRGRHDPCIVLRAVPCIEAAAAVALYDASLSVQR